MISFQTGFINPQLGNGPVAQAYFQCIQAELGISPSGYNSSKHYNVLEYFYNLSIGTWNPNTIGNANSFGVLGSGELASIGYLVGYPWPSVYAASFAGNFQFIPASGFPGTNPAIGFSSAASSITYGGFTSANPSQAGVYVNIPVYQTILKFIAQIKWNGLNIPAIDILIGNVLGYLGFPLPGAYTIMYGPNNDININFNILTTNISIGWLYVLQLIFARVCTIPVVNLSIS